MNSKSNSKFEQVRAQLGVKVAYPTFDRQSGIAQTWESMQQEITGELDSFDKMWELHTPQDEFRTSIQSAIKNLSSNNEYNEPDSTLNPKIETPEVETSEENQQLVEENQQLVLNLLEDVTQQLGDVAEQTDEPVVEEDKKNEQVAFLTSPILTEEASNPTSPSKKKSKPFLKGVGFFLFTKILIVVIAYFAVTVLPTYQISKQICGLSNLTIKLDKVGRNYRSGVTTIDSISAFDSENNRVYRTGKATFSGLSLFSTKQIHLDSAWIEDIDFVPQNNIPVCNDVTVTNSVSSFIHDVNGDSDITIATNDTSEYLFAQYTTQYLTRFLNNLARFCMWLPDDVCQSLKSTTQTRSNQNIVSTNNTKDISIKKLHLSGNTIFMGKPTIFAIDIENYSSHPTNNPMIIELAFGANRSGKLSIEIMRRETGSDMKIRFHNVDTNNQFSFGKLDELNIFQNEKKIENCLANCEIVMTVSRGRIKGELAMTQKVAKAQLSLKGISKPEEVEKLQTLIADLDSISVNDKFEGLYSTPVHQIKSNIDSLGQAIVEIAKSSRQQSNTSPIENTVLADTNPIEATSPEINSSEPELVAPQTDANVEESSNSKVAVDEMLPVLTPQAEEIPLNEEEQSAVVINTEAVKEQCTQDTNDIELTISDDPTIPLTAPNSPAIGNQTEPTTRSSGTPPPLPVFVNDEDEDAEEKNIKEDKQEEAVVRFTLTGRSKK